MEMKSLKVMNTLLAHVWDKGLKIYKHILMKAYEGKMKAFCKWSILYKTRSKAHERNMSDFVTGPSLK